MSKRILHLKCQVCYTYLLSKVYLKSYAKFLVINVWTTEPKRRISNQGRSSLPPNITFGGNLTPQTTVQKFGNQKTTISDVGLGAHEGKYTPSASVPNLATR